MLTADEGQGAVPEHVREPEGAVEMGEERAAARGFPLQVCGHGSGIAGEEHQALFALEVLGCGFGGLLGRREMHIAIREIDGRAEGFAVGFEMGPLGGAENLVDQHGQVMPLRADFVNGGLGQRRVCLEIEQASFCGVINPTSNSVGFDRILFTSQHPPRNSNKRGMKMRFGLLGSVGALALTAGMAQADYTLHVLHINDLHSRIESVNKYDSTCNAEGEAKGECFGGVARVYTKINELRDKIKAEGGNVIVLDAGDQFQGSLMYTTYKGAVEAEMMEKIGFDAMAVGNHEFDDGPDGLREFAGKVSFPIISGNLDLTRSNSLNGLVKNHVVLDVGGEKVAIISALATDTVDTSSPGPDVLFQDEIESLKADVDALTAEGVSKIIALNHVGVTKDMDIAGAVPGIDAVVGGHSHTKFSNTEEKAMKYPTMVGAVPVVSAYAYSKYVGHLVLTFDAAGVVTSATGDTILLDASVTPDAGVLARVAELAGPIEELKAKVVAATSDVVDGDRKSCRAVECSMGNLVAEAMLDRVADQGVTIAIQNGGGLRASIDAGEVTMGEVLTVLPFQNTLSTFQAKGSTIVAALENGASQMEEGAGRFAQVAGLKYTIDPKAAAGARVSDVMVKEGDGYVAIDLEKVYGVVTNDYVRKGGDGFKMFGAEGMNAYDYGPDLADVTAEYLAKNAPYAPFTDGRITIKE